MSTNNNARVITSEGAQHSLHETLAQAESARDAANAKAGEMGLSVVYESEALAVPVAG